MFIISMIVEKKKKLYYVSCTWEETYTGYFAQSSGHTSMHNRQLGNRLFFFFALAFLTTQ